MCDESDIPPLEDIPVNQATIKQTSTPVVKYVKPQPKAEQSVPNKSFAGLKKGFLSSSSTPKPKSNDLIEISAKKTTQTKDFRVLDEVQQAIKEEQLEKSSWITDDLLKEIQADESLAKYFSNPYFMEAINLFQRQPQEALAKYGHNAEVMSFFGRMAKILDKHFTGIAGKEKKQTQEQAVVDPEISKLLADEEVRNLLLDPSVMKLMEMLRDEPEKAQWTMRTADEAMRAKIKRLLELGLLSSV